MIACSVVEGDTDKIICIGATSIIGKNGVERNY
jgi:hypothetical protein